MAELEQKARYLRENVSHVVKINGSRAYHVTVDGDTVYYNLRRVSRTRYYYPIQYATVTYAHEVKA